MPLPSCLSAGPLLHLVFTTGCYRREKENNFLRGLAVKTRPVLGHFAAMASNTARLNLSRCAGVLAGASLLRGDGSMRRRVCGRNVTLHDAGVGRRGGGTRGKSIGTGDAVRERRRLQKWGPPCRTTPVSPRRLFYHVSVEEARRLAPVNQTHAGPRAAVVPRRQPKARPKASGRTGARTRVPPERRARRRVPRESFFGSTRSDS